MKACLKILCLALLPVFLLTSVVRAADNDWTYYESPTGAFKSHMPRDYTSTIATFEVGDYRAASAEDTSAQFKGGMAQKMPFSYVVKFDQTIGPALDDHAIVELVKKEFSTFENFYKQYNGVVNERDMNGMLDQYGGTLLITYNDPRVGEQTAKIRILVSGSTRLTQILVTKKENMELLPNQRFFRTFEFYDGLSVTKKKLRDAWAPLGSPLGLFTIYSPPQNNPVYFPDTPVVKNTDRAEIVSHTFKDPLRGESLFYNVYGYKVDNITGRPSAEAFITKEHLPKMGLASKKFSFKVIEGGGTAQAFSTNLEIRPSANFPYMSSARLKVTFDSGHLVVQELLGSSALVNSPFADSLLTAMDFYTVSMEKELSKPVGKVIPQ